MAVEIRLLGVEDLDAYMAHMEVHDRESGTEGDLPYGPYGKNEKRDPQEVRVRAVKRWSSPIDQPGWRRAWGLWSEGRVVGGVTLVGGELLTCLHRVGLGLGVERALRGQGWGRRLMEVAIDWARQEPRIDWIDLGVFEGNDRALSLYRKLGFVERCRVVDQFRIDGVQINDIQMSLWVGPPGR